MKIRYYISVTLLITTFSLFVPFVSAQSEEPIEEVITAVFTDVDIGHPEYVAVKYLAEKGILNGYIDGSFKPGNLINRVEALKVILEANNKIDNTFIEKNSLGGSEFATNPLTFTDIYKSQWYYPYLKKGVEIGVVQGYPDSTFRPLDIVNKVETYKMAMESDGIVLPEVAENPFADVPVYEWFAPYILEGKLREIVWITMQNLVYPGLQMSRSKYAELVYMYMRSKEGIKFGKGSYYSDYFEGRGTASGEPYLASELTAAHLTLPFNTMVKVTNLANDQSVTVRINDRGPYITGRVIDLSRSAFEEIAHPGSGVIWIQYEILNEA